VTRSSLVVIGPLPPPIHGVSISTALVLANPLLAARFELQHVDTSDPRTRSNIGRWDVTNVLLGLRAAYRLSRSLSHGRGVVYLTLSQGVPGFLRDSLFVHCAALRGWRVAAHLRGSDFPDFYARRGALLRWWIRFTLSRVTSIAVPGWSLTGLFDGLVPRERIAVVPNGTPDVGSDAGPRDPETVLFLSNLRRRKGVRESVEAALLVLEQHPTARFVFAGDWEDEQLQRELREQASHAGERIRFLPAVNGEDKRRLLVSASVLLFPPVEPEGHSRVVLEGLAAGLPVVTTNRGAIAETVIDGESGFVLDDPVPQELADRILALLGDADLRSRVGRAARTRYLAEFTQETADRRIADWLEELAALSEEASTTALSARQRDAQSGRAE
jgi:glycosyltransferase involved in cell wall biosynthesis